MIQLSFDWFRIILFNLIIKNWLSNIATKMQTLLVLEKISLNHENCADRWRNKSSQKRQKLMSFKHFSSKKDFVWQIELIEMPFSWCAVMQKSIDWIPECLRALICHCKYQRHNYAIQINAVLFSPYR